MSKPITKQEVAGRKAKTLPPGVIECWNDLITKHWDGRSAVVKQNEAVSALMSKMDVDARQQIFDNGWIDIEPVFRAAGWKVKYDKPDYTESYEAFFEFS